MIDEQATSAGLVALYKLIASAGASIAFGIGAALASVVVMCMTLPRTAREWTVALISTVVGSIGGGSFVLVHFGFLTGGVHTGFEAAAILGIAFACGLPAWAVVRMSFNWIEKNRDKTIVDAVNEVRGTL